MQIYTIYKVSNKINNKVYIGFDSNWPKRKKTHLRNSKNVTQKDYNSALHSALRKYGENNFDWGIIYQSLYKYYTINVMEKYFITEYNSYGNKGYNLTKGGEGTFGFSKEPWNKGKKLEAFSNNWKKNMSISRTGQKQSDDTKLKRIETMKKLSGMYCSCVTCKKVLGFMSLGRHYKTHI